MALFLPSEHHKACSYKLFLLPALGKTEINLTFAKSRVTENLLAWTFMEWDPEISFSKAKAGVFSFKQISVDTVLCYIRLQTTAFKHHRPWASPRTRSCFSSPWQVGRLFPGCYLAASIVRWALCWVKALHERLNQGLRARNAVCPWALCWVSWGLNWAAVLVPLETGTTTETSCIL